MRIDDTVLRESIIRKLFGSGRLDKPELVEWEGRVLWRNRTNLWYVLFESRLLKMPLIWRSDKSKI